MASDKSVNSKCDGSNLGRHTTCYLGNHPLENPKLLPCQHSFCARCIKTKVSQDRKEFICPKCELSVPLTKKGVDVLPENVLFRILQEAENENTNCTMCTFENKNIPGTFQCLDCSDVTCDRCQAWHTKSSITRLHRLVPLKDVQSGLYKKELEAVKQPLCHTHSKANTPMILQSYCEECKCLACQICVLTLHQPNGHTCKTIEETHDENSIEVTDHVTQLLGLKQLDEEFAAELEQGQGQNKKLQVELEDEVYQRAALFIDLIEKVKQDKLTEIKGHFDTEHTSIQAKLNETKNGIIRTDSIVSYTQTFLEHSSKVEFLQHKNEIMKTLLDQMQEKNNRNLNIKHLEIGEPQIEATEAFLAEAFGKINVAMKTLGKMEKQSEQRHWLNEPKVLFSVESRINEAWDLTVAENEDIIAVGSSYISLIGKDGKHKELTNCSRLGKACNVVAKADYLYVSDYEANGYILVMDFAGNVIKTITLPQTCGEHYDKALATDDEGNVYVSSQQIHTIYKCEQSETNAKVFIKLDSHPDLKELYFFCVTPWGEVIVSNCTSNTILCYGKLGELLWRYRGQGDLVLDHPRGIKCDRDGFIYVADSLNHRIQVIKNGEFQTCIKIKGFSYPRCIDFDKEGNIVCGYEVGKIITKIKVWE